MVAVAVAVVEGLSVRKECEREIQPISDGSRVSAHAKTQIASCSIFAPNGGISFYVYVSRCAERSLGP